MTEPATDPTLRLIAVASDISAAYVSNNHVTPADLPMLVTTVYASLMKQASRTAAAAVAPEPKPAPAQIRESITAEALVSLIDGKSYKTLKRHLTKHGFTPDSYRARFGLPADYPMVSTAYASRRSDLAKEHKFGIRAGRGAKHRVK